MMENTAARLLNDKARHEMIVRLYRDILLDLTICDIEGWDKTEYIRQLQDVVNHFRITEEAQSDER